jgi:hypothetical protein
MASRDRVIGARHRGLAVRYGTGTRTMIRFLDWAGDGWPTATTGRAFTSVVDELLGRRAHPRLQDIGCTFLFGYRYAAGLGYLRLRGTLYPTNHGPRNYLIIYFIRPKIDDITRYVNVKLS